MSTLSTDPADLFIEIYDELEASLGGVLQADDFLDWMTDETSTEVSSWIEGDLVDLGHVDPPAIRESIEQVDEPDDPTPGQRRRFAILWGLDRAFAHINPHSASYDPAGLLHLAVRYAETGQLNSDTGGRA